MNTLEHRGPDDHGTYVAPGVGLASRRLAILDLSARGRMPLQTPDGRYVISYNGEVYNYRALRAELLSEGATFVSDTDTEVVLRLFERDGPDMLSKLNGMFAIAIWDARERTLFVARDRVGVKPMYYVDTGDALLFASEEKAVFALGHAARFDPAVVPELLVFKYTSGERTPFEGVERLLPGHYLLWRDGQTNIRRWWHLGERAAALRDASPSDGASWFRDTFDEAVDATRISDVPVGVLLSGGLDSTSVAASMARRDPQEVASFTVRFAEHGYDEGPAATAFAARLGLAHHDLEVSPGRLESLLERAAWLSDEPLAHSSDLHLLAMSDHAKNRVSVLLSGEGADELLGGYARYQPLRYANAFTSGKRVAQALLHTPVRGRMKKLAHLVAAVDPNAAVMYGASDVMPQELTQLGLAGQVRVPFRDQTMGEAGQLYPDDLFRQALYLDLHTYLASLLHRNDRMTMGASIECRVPFLDHRLVEGIAALPTSTLLCGNRGKPLLRQAIGHRLPDDILTHRKWGFGVPWGHYLRTHGAFKALVTGLHRDETLSMAGCNPRQVESVVRRFLAGDARDNALVFQLFMLTTWHRAYFARLADAADGRKSGVTPAIDSRTVPDAAVPVLLVGNFLSADGGSRSICEELASRLPQDGCPVLTTSSRRSKTMRLIDMVGTAWRQRRRYAVAQIDVFSGPAFFWAEAVCATLGLAGKPYVLTLHGGNLPAFAARHASRVRRLLQSASAVTTPSQYLLQACAPYRDDIRLIPNGLDVDAYRMRSRSEVGPRLVWLRAFHELYNPSLAIRILPLIRPRFPDLHLTMTGPDKGDGSLQAARQLAAELGVEAHVSFHRQVAKAEVPRVLAEGDIFLNTTNVDNTPVSVIEAMACGLCVVTTRVGGTPFLVDDEQDGLLVPPADPQAMADAVLRILDQPELAHRLSLNARQKAEQFDWSPIVSTWRNLLAKTAERAA